MGGRGTEGPPARATRPAAAGGSFTIFIAPPPASYLTRLSLLVSLHIIYMVTMYVSVYLILFLHLALAQDKGAPRAWPPGDRTLSPLSPRLPSCSPPLLSSSLPSPLGCGPLGCRLGGPVRSPLRRVLYPPSY